jgi:hypothetical protein
MVELDQLWMCLWVRCDYKCVQGKSIIIFYFFYQNKIKISYWTWVKENLKTLA